VTRAVLLLRRLPCWNEHDTARHVTARHVTTRTKCRACRVVTWRSKWNWGFIKHSEKTSLLWGNALRWETICTVDKISRLALFQAQEEEVEPEEDGLTT